MKEYRFNDIDIYIRIYVSNRYIYIYINIELYMQNGYKYNIYVRACVCKSHDDCDFTEVTELYVFTV